jgi:hypothetical protein
LVLANLYAGIPLSVSCFRLKSMHQDFVPGDNTFQEFVALTFISQQELSENVHTFLFQFLSEHSGKASGTTFGIRHQHLSPALAHVNGNFVCYYLLRNTTIPLIISSTRFREPRRLQ